MADLYERLDELLERNEESRPGVKDFAMAIHSSFLREVMEALAYAREVCLENGHVRTGVGDMNRCSRCGELVDDASMEAQRRQGERHAYRHGLYRGILEEFVIHASRDHACDGARRGSHEVMARAREALLSE